MAYYDEDNLFNALEIRDTATHDSIESLAGEFTAKTIIVESSLNQDVSCQLQGARDAVWYDIGAAFVITASTNQYQTVSTYFPKYRINATCSVAPVSGSLNIWLIKAGAL